jgi:hypothetical protein
VRTCLKVFGVVAIGLAGSAVACSSDESSGRSQGTGGAATVPGVTGGTPSTPGVTGGTPGTGGKSGTPGQGGTPSTPGQGGTPSTPGQGGTPTAGGAPPAGGGVPAAGGGGASGGAAEGPPTGYFTSGTWKGFAWTSTFGTGNTISPANFEGVATWPICAKGTVAGVADGSNGAMLGWNLNQEPTTDAPLATVTPGKMGVSVNITATVAAQLRLQIQAADGADNAMHRWCAEIGTGGANIFVPYSSFNTECWPGGEGVPYDGTTPISQVIIQVPSAETNVNFDFCVNSIAETDMGGMAGAGCDLTAMTSGSALTGTLASSNKYQRVATNTGSPVINVQNNIFGMGGQYDISYNGPSFTIALTDIPTAWRWSGSGTEFNVAYDVWFSPTAGDGGPGSRSFLMVWFHKTANVFAEGEGEQHSGGQATINGKSFSTYVSQQFEGRPIISYVATSTINEWSFDLNDFITDAKTRTSTAQATAVINNNLYLTNVFAGFEVWSGVSNLKTDKFCIQVK